MHLNNLCCDYISVCIYCQQFFILLHNFLFTFLFKRDMLLSNKRQVQQMGIGAKLDKLLKEQGSNPNELALKVGVSAQTIYSMIKRDSKKADIEVLIKISEELGVEPEYFCDTVTPKEEKDSFEKIELLIARNGKELTPEKRMRLIKLLSEFE